MPKNSYREFRIEKEKKIINKIAKLCGEGVIEKIYPLTNIESHMRLYKTDGFNIATYENEDTDIVEVSRYGSKKNIDEKISELEELLKTKLSDE